MLRHADGHYWQAFIHGDGSDGLLLVFYSFGSGLWISLCPLSSQTWRQNNVSNFATMSICYSKQTILHLFLLQLFAMRWSFLQSQGWSRLNVAAGFDTSSQDGKKKNPDPWNDEPMREKKGTVTCTLMAKGMQPVHFDSSLFRY
jgi:hypothetical protein